MLKSQVWSVTAVIHIRKTGWSFQNVSSLKSIKTSHESFTTKIIIWFLCLSFNEKERIWEILLSRKHGCSIYIRIWGFYISKPTNLSTVQSCRLVFICIREWIIKGMKSELGQAFETLSHITRKKVLRIQ